MPQTKKIQGKFYPLKSEEWLDSINQLTHSELKILYYIRSLDPYSNGINLTPAQIARDLTTEKHKMHRSTVGRALKSLDRKGFINMELLRVRLKINPKGFLSETEPVKTKNNVVATQQNNVVATQQCCDHATQVVTTQHDVSPHNTSCDHTTQVVTTQQLSSEMLSEQASQNPKTLQTYTDFKKTLSEDERENFLKFVEEVIRNLEKPINDLEAWLASKNAANQNRWEVYYQNYQKQKGRNSQQDSGSDSISVAEKNSAIALWQEHLKQQKLAAQEAQEKLNEPRKPQIDQSTEQNSSNNDLKSPEEDLTEKKAQEKLNEPRKPQTEPEKEQNSSNKASESSKEDLTQEFDQIFNNPEGFTKNTSQSSSPPPKPDPSQSRKMSVAQGLDILRNLDMMQQFDNIQDPDMGGEES